jgi:O-antigen ligase
VTTARNNTTPTQTTLRTAIEFGVLAFVALVPLAIMPESLVAGFIQVPKVFLARSIALLLLVLVAFDWAQRSGTTAPIPSSGVRALRDGAVATAKAHPAMVGAVAVLAATVLSTLLSPVWIVSIAGTEAGWDSYGLFTLVSYLVSFAVAATYLRTETQIRRLLWVITGAAWLLGVYGIGQHFGVDWFRNDATPPARIALTSGNPIFGAAYLVMTIPLTLMVWQGWRNSLSPVVHVVIGAGLIVPQLASIAFTLSRGSLVSLVVSLAVLLALIAWVQGRRAAIRPATILGALLAAGVALSLLPVPGVPSAGRELIERLMSIGPELSGSGGIANRTSIWEDASKALLKSSWVDTDEFPELPTLSVKPLRPLVGYGPDMFRHAFTQGDDAGLPTETAHGHNFFVHTLVELGLIGVLAYVGMIAAVGMTLVRLLRAAKRGETPSWVTHAALALAAVFVGKIIEQFTGKAQVSDLSLSWVLAGVVVALAALTMASPAEASALRAVERPERRGRRARGRTRAASAGSTDRVQLAIAVVLAIASVVFWWQAIFANLNGGILAGRGQQAGLDGDAAAAGRLLQHAVDAVPGAYPSHILLSRGWLNSARLEPDPARRQALLETSYALAEAILERNPLDVRARITTSEVSSELAVIDPVFRAQTLRDQQILAALWPKAWRMKQGLALALTGTGDYEGALRVVEEAKAQGAAGVDSYGRNPAAYQLYFAEALALRGLGREEEAQSIISYLDFKVTTPFPEAQAVIDALGGLRE